jgi:hypothetical protein
MNDKRQKNQLELAFTEEGRSEAPRAPRIEYTRGAAKIVNRKKLEDSACECYGIIRPYDGEFGLK